MTGAESLVRTLLTSGVNVCFANPGTSEMHFVSALDRVDGMRCVLGLFEGVVTGAADGYYRVADRPASTLLHLGPGLGNGLANLHNARRAHSGIVNIVGEHATHHIQHDAPLTSDIEGVARPMSDWVRTARSAGSVAADGAEAIRVARSTPGKIATLIVPADATWNQADGPTVAPAPAAPPRPGTDAVASAARALRHGSTAMLLLGGAAVREKELAMAGRIAARTGCSLATEFYCARHERGAGRVQARRVPYPVDAGLEMFRPVRQLVLVGARRPVAFFAHPGKPSVLVPDECAITTLATIEEDLAGALEALAAELGALELAPAGVAQRAQASLPTGALTSEGIGAVLAALMPENAIVVDESITVGRSFGRFTAGAAPHAWLSGMGGSIGFGLPVAVGAAIAAPDRKVIALSGDGSAMYTFQSLWSMAREGLDVTILVFANRSYEILRGELAAVGAGAPGPRASDLLSIDRPTLDWTALARGQGVEAGRAADLSELARELGRGLASGGPYLVELAL
jgi:acetolactate synthase I/II/III large subunit